jgi:hypothetical protein
MNYLYNGVELPPLPQWDKTAYPFAAIDRQGDKSTGYAYFLRCTANQVKDTGITFLFYAPLRSYKIVDDEWAYSTDSDSNYGAPKSSHSLVWADHDVYKGDTIVLAASDPIPVGGEPIDPTSFMQGYIVGRRLAGMRK